jgi:MFS family permease
MAGSFSWWRGRDVTLPTLVRDLDASTRQLQWIVDSYNLVFAALVLAAGSISDRVGRKGGLLSRGSPSSPLAASSVPVRARPAS